MNVNFESMLQRSNEVQHHVESNITILDAAVIHWKVNDTQWSVMEVISHLNQVYELYFPKFDRVIETAKPLNDDSETKVKSTILGKLSIYSMTPKKKKIRFKMKTFDFFEPTMDTNEPNAILERYLGNKQKFNEYIRQFRLLDVAGVKVSTALGERVKFYVPECIEFLLAHEERHMVQIENILEKQNVAV